MQTELIQFIRDTIRANGPQSFAWFMEQALYHPEHGYYSSGRATIGRRGDYFTNVSVSPMFGRLLAAQFTEMWERLGKLGRRGDIDNFIIVEQGAHDGQFARDVLEAIREMSPEFFAALRYRIIEPFSVWQDRQAETLAAFANKVEWTGDFASSRNPHLNPLPRRERRTPPRRGQVRVTQFEPFTGVHFSNELLDAMPIALRDKVVGLDGDDFVFVGATASNEKTNQSQLDWIDSVATDLQRGFVLAIDYGFAREDFREIIQTRAQHRHLDSPFQEIGDADITAHINWTDLAERAEAKGLRVAGFTDQHHFLTGIISEWPRLLETPSLDLTALSRQVRRDAGGDKGGRALQTLLHPEMLGRAFQVLLLNKDVDLARPLAGFKFAREPRTTILRD